MILRRAAERLPRFEVIRPISEVDPDPEFWLVGEAPAADSSRAHLDVVLALRAVGRTPMGGAVRVGRDLPWLADNHPGLFKFVGQTRHRNLLDEWPGRKAGSRKGSGFPSGPARAAAYSVLEEVADGTRSLIPSRVLLAGLRVAAAFGLRAPQPYFTEVMVCGGIPFEIVPHPSGVSRWWNSSANQRQARAYLERLGEER